MGREDQRTEYPTFLVNTLTLRGDGQVIIAGIFGKLSVPPWNVGVSLPPFHTGGVRFRGGIVTCGDIFSTGERQGCSRAVYHLETAKERQRWWPMRVAGSCEARGKYLQR